MLISWIDIISIFIAIISFVYALIERSKRMPLWWTMKGLEQNSMSNMALYNGLILKYKSDTRIDLSKNEFLAHLDNVLGIWSGQREMIIGIRNSIDSKLKKEDK